MCRKRLRDQMLTGNTLYYFFIAWRSETKG